MDVPFLANSTNESKALLLPADGSQARLVSYCLKQRNDEDRATDFWEDIPDLRPWLGDAFPERDFTNFYVDSKEQDDSKYTGFVQSDNPSIYGKYCIYYTSSSRLPLNETCRRFVEADPQSGRLFWRGDVLLVRYTGELGLGHKYIDAPAAMLGTAADVLKRIYSNEGLEKKADFDKEFDLEIERSKLRFPNFYKAVETGAIERYRTRATMDEEDVSLINSLSNYIVKWPNGVRTSLFNQLLPPEYRDKRLDSSVTLPAFSPEMAVDVPCSACSWTPQRQNSCRYNSHVKLFYGVSDRGVWSLGSQFILKERSDNPPSFEAKNIQFLKEKTSIPVPNIIKHWREDDGRYFMLTERICGEPLNILWPTLSAADRERIAKQTARYLLQLRELHSSQMQSLDGQPLYSAFLFPNGYGIPHGPLSSDDELWGEIVKSLEKVPEKARQCLRQLMPSAAPYTFTHGDLTDVNILVKDGNLSGILDWEASGYFPVWWEFICAGIGLGKGDYEWKSLLQKHMPHHTKAREFWRSFYALRKYPELDEEGEQLLQALLTNGTGKT